MSRRVIAASLFTLTAVAACSKSTGSQDTGGKAAASASPGVAAGAPPEGVAPPTMKGAVPDVGAAPAAAGEDPFKLQPSEGTLQIEIPAAAKAGTEVVARVLVTPSAAYKINKEFPTKLTVEPPAGVTVAKAQLVAGGHDGSKGDADAFEDKQLAFSVKLTPSQSGAHTVSGTFKFAVCDKDTCLAKKEKISIALAAQ